MNCSNFATKIKQFMSFKIPSVLIALVFVSSAAFSQVVDVATARGQNIGSTISVKVIVTTGTSLDPSSGSTRYFQDATGGLSAFGNDLAPVQPGDSIIITGELSEFFQLKQISPVTNVQIVNSGNPLPSPEVLTINDAMQESKECMLVQIPNVTFDQGGSFSGQSNYNITDVTGNGDLRVNGNTNLVGTPIPSAQVAVTGVIGRFNANQQILPRSVNDIGNISGPEFVELPEQTNIQTTSFDLEFSSDVDAAAVIEWGETPDLTETPLIETNENTEHIFTLSGLQPAAFYYARAGLIENQDTSYSPVGYYSTKSLSSGNIKVWFNAPVDTTVATEKVAMSVGSSVVDSIIAIIESAESTLDIAIYNWNNNGIRDISQSINDAHNRGVRVRMITDRSTATLGFNDLVQGVPRMESPSGQNYGIMHNKFVIVDAEDNDADKPLVITGSMNWTDGQVNRDPNNTVVFQDRAMARAYTLEFEEMWGSTNATPNYNNSKFGPDKSSNTPRLFMLNESEVELYFSPTDAAETNIVNSLEAATDDIEVATMLMTRTPYAYAVRNAVNDNGVYGGFIIDDTTYQNSSLPYSLVGEALNEDEHLFVHNRPNTLHHKYAIVDQSNPFTGDPRVITGSHNWSNAANTRNDENTVIIHSAEVANIFFQEWVRRFTDLGGEDYIVIASAGDQARENRNIAVYPNPFVNQINVTAPHLQGDVTLNLYDVSGQLVRQFRGAQAGNVELNTTEMKSGMYILEIMNNGKSTRQKVVKP